MILILSSASSTAKTPKTAEVGQFHQKNHSYCAPLRCAQACGARKRAFPVLYPAFTSQHVRKTAPTLTRHAGLLSAAPLGLVARSLDD